MRVNNNFTKVMTMGEYNAFVEKHYSRDEQLARISETTSFIDRHLKERFESGEYTDSTFSGVFKYVDIQKDFVDTFISEMHRVARKHGCAVDFDDEVYELVFRKETLK